MARKKTSSNSPNLRGYKREGKRFIPPLKQLPNVRGVGYLDTILPELIWLGLIHDLHGYHFSAKVIKSLASLPNDWRAPENLSNLALQSTYYNMSDDEKRQVINAWEVNDLLGGIQTAVAPLVLLYDRFALSFVGPPTELLPQESLILRLKTCVENHNDRYANKAVILIGYMMMSRIEAGKMSFVKGIAIPDFNSIYDDPDSDSAQHAASFLRASAYGEFGMFEQSSDWPRYFWNRGAELTRCELPESVSDD
jgi:hypothetical protein